jgi:hypothetical protein
VSTTWRLSGRSTLTSDQLSAALGSPADLQVWNGVESKCVRSPRPAAERRGANDCPSTFLGTHYSSLACYVGVALNLIHNYSNKRQRDWVPRQARAAHWLGCGSYGCCCGGARNRHHLAVSGVTAGAVSAVSVPP